MKKTFNINIAGFPFIIDDDYTLLNDYIDTIEHAFSNLEDYRELVADIESRIAELLLEQTSTGSPIVTVGDVEDVIRRVGKPEDMVEEDENINITSDSEGTTVNETIREEEMVTPPPYVPPIKVQKKLFRDTQNSMLGGVCSGLAWYLNIDATWVRLLTVAAVIVSFATVAIAYIILWIVVPEARTPLQRMQMMGEEPTMENIGKTVTDNFREDRGEQAIAAPAANNSFSNTISSALGIIVKILIVIGLIIGIPVLVALGAALLGCLFALIMVTTSIFTDTVGIWDGMPVELVKYLTLLGVGAIIVIGIPLSLLIRKGLKPKGHPMGGGAKWTLLGVWIAGFILAAVSSLFFVREMDKLENNRYNRVRIERFSDRVERKLNRAAEKLGRKRQKEINIQLPQGRRGKSIQLRQKSKQRSLETQQKRIENKQKQLENKQKALEKQKQVVSGKLEEVKKVTATSAATPTENPADSAAKVQIEAAKTVQTDSIHK